MRTTNINTKITKLLSENKTSIKTYASYEKAALVGAEKSTSAIGAFAYGPHAPSEGPDFIIAYVDGRFTPVFILSSWMNAHSLGGYIGFFAQQGFCSL